jgi:ferrous iron transport protein A
MSMSSTTQQITLDQVPVGKQVTVVRVGGEKVTRRRLLDMGLVAGETVIVQGVAPLGDPINILVKSYSLALRKREACQITVEVQV